MRVWSCTHEKKKALQNTTGSGCRCVLNGKIRSPRYFEGRSNVSRLFRSPATSNCLFHFPWDFEIAGFRSTVNQKLFFFGKHVFYVTWHVLVQSQIEMHAIRLVASGDAGTSSSQLKWRTPYQGQGAGEVRNRANRSLKGEFEASFLLMHLRISIALHCYRCCKSWTM